MLFVHPDPNAGSIMDWFEGVDTGVGPHKPEELPEYTDARNTYEIKANWKIVVENYIDVYHLAHLHSGTLAMYDHSKAEYGFVGPHFLFWEPPVAEYAKDQDKKLPAPRVIPKDQNGAWVPMMFPGVGIGATEDNWSVFIIEPLAPDRTRVINRTRVADVSSWEFTKQAMRSSGFWAKFGVGGKYSGDDVQSKDDAMASGDFSAEDIHACEQLQKSLYSPHFEAGPAAKGEAPVLDHQKMVLQWMERESGDVSAKPIHLKRKRAKATADDAIKGMAATASIKLREVTTEVAIAENQTVLEAVKAAGLKPPFSCQAGVCGACKATLVNGTVHMRARMALKDIDIKNGAILTCQSVATSEHLTIRYEK